ncbi:MAG: hypothetical protein ACTHW1_05345 [Ancrocorticia sp.]|uniref:hypothetical protein n=1 Tax=Ancrocorticia sp. TaxID=2593684 RepID=UPI003F8E14CD
MPTPTDPYSSAARRPFDEDDVLAPIQSTAQSAPEPANGYSGITAASAEEPTHGMDPAFDSDPRPEDAGPASLADAIVRQDGTTEPRSPRASSSPGTAGGAGSPSTPGTESGAELGASSPATSEGTPVEAGEATPDIFADDDELFATKASSSEPAEAKKSRPAPVPEAPGSRGWAHAGVLIATIVLAPLAWYFLSDASIRLSGVANNPWETGVLNWAAIGELAGGIAIVSLIWMLARNSSLGIQVVGAITLIAGIVPLIAPTFVRDTVLPKFDSLIGGYNDFTANVVDHITSDLSSGRFLMFGAFLLLTGFVSHSVRRKGERAGDARARRSIALDSQAQ